MAKRQDESDATVKKLVDLNKEFKRTTSEVALVQLPRLIIHHNTS